MIKQFTLALGALGVLFFASCAPLHSSAVQEQRPAPVYTMPGSWGSGGHYTGFSESRPSSNGFNTGANGAPC